MPHFDANHSYAVDLTGKVIFDDPLPGGRRPAAYEQPEITTQPGAACERLLRRSSFGIAPPLPQPAGELSKEMRAVLLHVSRAAAQPTRGNIGHRPLDRAGLTAASIVTRIGWMRDQRGKPSPDADRTRRLLEAMVAAGLLVRLGEGSGARYTTPQIAGRPADPPAAPLADEAPTGIQLAMF